MTLWFVLAAALVVALLAYTGRRARRAGARQRKPVTPPERPPAIEADELVPCRKCGAYVPAKGARACARRDCVYR